MHRLGDFSVTKKKSFLDILINSVQKNHKYEIYKYTKSSPLPVKSYVETWSFKTLMLMETLYKHEQICVQPINSDLDVNTNKFDSHLLSWTCLVKFEGLHVQL